MKNLKGIFEILNVQNSEAYFEEFTKSLKNNITTWDYFVNWDKVVNNVEKIELELNILNYLIGKSNDVIKLELKKILKEYPKVALLFPILVAFREKHTKILVSYDFNTFNYKDFYFNLRNKLSENEIDDIIYFAEKTGILKLISDKRIKNMVDYVVGIEVGLDSNGRKNRTGKLMESIVELFISKICKKYEYEYLTQANAKKIKEKWGLNITVDKSSRRIDFVIRTKQHLFIIETNFYAGGGSKLKSTAGEYRSMFDYWKKDGHEFVWITDGFGWNKTLKPLSETFEHIDYILNLEFVARGVLENILTKDS